MAVPTPQEMQRTHVAKYGYWWKRLPGVPRESIGYEALMDIHIERYILGNYNRAVKAGAKLLPWTEHFMRFVTLIWGRKECARKFSWNPYAVRMLENAHANNYLAVAGHASSGKSEFFAIWAICSYLIGAVHPDHPGKPASPEFVKVFLTSTTMEESMGRIWGVVEAYWSEACRCFGGEQYMNAKLVSSGKKIVHIGHLDGKPNQLAGIVLVAAGKGNDSDAKTKIGFKNRSVVFIADELPLLTHAIYEHVLTNLHTNPHFQFIGIGNFTSAFDPFGVFSEPKDGWASVDENTDEWFMREGKCIRFDGEKSPNVIAGREVWAGLLTLEVLLGHRERLGTKSPEYYRMVRSFLSPDGDNHAIYTETEVVASHSQSKVATWITPPRLIAFLDPSFSQGGDEAPLCIARTGTFYNPLMQRNVVCIERVETINLMLGVDASNRESDRNQQLVSAMHKECTERGIAVEDRGVDSTGAGDPFSTLMAITMGRGFQMVSFAGAASDKPVSATDRRPGKVRFANRVSELWGVGKELMRSGQIRGLDPDTINQMTARLYTLVGKECMEVESKKAMRKRTNGKSPDRADAFFGCVEIARRRHGLTSIAKFAQRPVAPAAPNRDARQEAMEQRLGLGKHKPRATFTMVMGATSGWGE